jgi:DNA repair protein RecO (recombination protein O)
MSTFITQGVVLGREHYGDYDWQYTIYTREAGKVTAIVKGGKKITSKLNSHLDYFLTCDLMLARGNRFMRVASTQVVQNYKNIKNDLEKIVIANYFLEVINVLTGREFCDFELFELINNFFIHLDQVEGIGEKIICLNKYIFELLSHLGYCPLIKSKTQKQLIRDLHKLILEVGERQIKSYNLLQKIIK